MNSISVPNNWNILYLSTTQIRWNDIILHQIKNIIKQINLWEVQRIL